GPCEKRCFARTPSGTRQALQGSASESGGVARTPHPAKSRTTQRRHLVRSSRSLRRARSKRRVTSRDGTAGVAREGNQTPDIDLAESETSARDVGRGSFQWLAAFRVY